MIDCEIFSRAELQALKSKKKNTKVGALLLDNEGKIIFEACNDYISPIYGEEDLESGPHKKLYSEHAERNLIYLSIRSGNCNFIDKTLVVTHFPCTDCARAIILVGIRKVIVGAGHLEEGFYTKWKENIEVSHRMLEQNGVEVNYYK